MEVAHRDRQPDRLDDLARRARAGEPGAIERLLSECQPDIRAFAARSCRAGEDVEDAVQHAMTVVYRDLGGFRGAARFTSWLFAVVRNECSRLRRLSERIVLRHEFPSGDDVPLTTDRVELTVALSAAISSLPEMLRTTFILRDVEGLTTAEAASELGISESNVKVRLHRARTQLRHSLARSGVVRR